MNSSVRLKKYILSVIIILVIIFVSFYGFRNFERSGKAPVNIGVFPGDALVTIDNTPVYSGIHYLSPGIYEITATRDGFDSHSRTLVVDESSQTVAIILSANTDEALRWVKAKENRPEYNKVFGLGQIAAQEDGSRFHKLNPIAKDLPYKTFFYSVGYRTDKSDPSGNSILIEIDASDGYRQSAVYRIRQLGYDPTDFNINFRDYENPFPL